jgi:hypothetical protein
MPRVSTVRVLAMDNRRIDVSSEGKDALAHALAIIWDSAAGGHATHYIETCTKTQTRYYACQDERLVANASLSGVALSNVKHVHIHHFENTILAEEGDGVPTLVLLWHAGDFDDKKVQKLPFKLNLQQSIDFCQGWLDSLDYNKALKKTWSSDVWHHNGFRAFTDYWGHVIDNHYAIVGIQPEWALYGK